jgi:hypothetical protein
MYNDIRAMRDAYNEGIIEWNEGVDDMTESVAKRMPEMVVYRRCLTDGEKCRACNFPNTHFYSLMPDAEYICAECFMDVMFMIEGGIDV